MDDNARDSYCYGAWFHSYRGVGGSLEEVNVYYYYSINNTCYACCVVTNHIAFLFRVMCTEMEHLSKGYSYEVVSESDCESSLTARRLELLNRYLGVDSAKICIKTIIGH